MARYDLALIEAGVMVAGEGLYPAAKPAGWRKQAESVRARLG